MTDIRQRIIQKALAEPNPRGIHWIIAEAAARETAILIRERLEYYEFTETLMVIDDLLASLVSAETPTETP